MQDLIHEPYLLISSFIFFIVLIIFLWKKFFGNRKTRSQYYQDHAWENSYNPQTITESFMEEEIGPVRILQAEEILKKSDEHPWPKTLSLYIRSKQHQFFYGYDLMQVILNHGFVHGNLNFFHYIENQHTLFSLANLKPPGGFNLNEMGSFKTNGLCLFLQPYRFPEPEIIFDQMLIMAEKLTEDLNGILEDEHHHLLTPERANYWRSFLQVSES